MSTITSASKHITEENTMPGIPEAFVAPAIPTTPIELKPFNNIYTLYFRHGMNANCSKGFYFNGDIRAAIQRAMKHCDAMGYKYVFVRPLVADIDSEESIRSMQNHW